MNIFKLSKLRPRILENQKLKVTKLGFSSRRSSGVSSIQTPITKEFLQRHLTETRCHLTPELNLHLLTPSCPLYSAPATSSSLSDPWWSIFWPGGQVLARTILDSQHLVRNKHVLDLGSGCGAVAIAAMVAGAASVVANDIDPDAAVAVLANAELNKITGEIVTDTKNILEGNLDALQNIDVLLIGDMFYDEHIGGAVLNLCRKFKAMDSSKDILMGDPGRWFLETNQEVDTLFWSISKYSLGEECKKENYGFHQGIVWKFK